MSNRLQTAVAALGRYPALTILATVALGAGAVFTINDSSSNPIIQCYASGSGCVIHDRLTVQSVVINTGATLTESSGDARYVNTAGDTMTGVLTVNVTGGNENTEAITTSNTISGAQIQIGGNEVSAIKHAYFQVAASGANLAVGKQQGGAAPPAFSGSIVSVRANCATAGNGLVTYDVNIEGTSVLSTKLTVDANETSSDTAAAAAVINTSNKFNQNADITVDVDSDAGGTAPIGDCYVRVGALPDFDGYAPY